jgi:hypothetical protein
MKDGLEKERHATNASTLTAKDATDVIAGRLSIAFKALGQLADSM